MSTWARRFGDITAIITEDSVNRKTGSMLQVWIVPTGVSPLDAVRTGLDEKVCGRCGARPRIGGWCYCDPRPLMSLWKGRHSWRPFNLNELPPEVPVRLGAWGDPAFLPLDWLHRLVEGRDWTGYTHQWRTCGQRYRHLLMASVDFPEEARTARKAGWRTFRIRLPDEPLLAGEVPCRYARGKTCSECRLCGGGTSGPSVSIVAHGTRVRRYFEFCERRLLRTGV